MGFPVPQPLLKPDEVANLLKLSVRTVYDNKHRLGGFYPGGIKALRFRAGTIYGIMEGQKTQGLAIQLPVQGENLCRRGPQNQGGCKDSPRVSERPGQDWRKTEPGHHGL